MTKIGPGPPAGAPDRDFRFCRWAPSRVGVVTTASDLRSLSAFCVMLAKRINQNSHNLNSGVGSRLARGQHQVAPLQTDEDSPQLMSPVARRLSDPSVGESQLILVSVIP